MTKEDFLQQIGRKVEAWFADKWTRDFDQQFAEMVKTEELCEIVEELKEI